MSNETRKVPVIFMGGNVGISKSEKNMGKKYISLDVAELAMSNDGTPYVRGFGQGKARQLTTSYFKWLDEWHGNCDFEGIEPLDIINLIFEGSGLSVGKLVDFELVENTGVADKYFAV